MQKYQDTVVVSTPTLIPLAGAVVTILNTSGGSSNMYSDNGVTVVASVTTDTNGRYSFYAADGKYTITITPPAPYSVVVLTDVVIEDPNVAHPILGITDGSSSAAGYIGEYISAQVLAAAPVNIPTNTPTNILSITLTPGKWEVWGHDYFVMAGDTIQYKSSGISSISATLPVDDTADYWSANRFRTIGSAVPIRRFNILINTVIYLVAFALIDAGTVAVSGELVARRVG